MTLLGVVLVCGSAVRAMAITVDGRCDGFDEDYSQGFSFDFEVEGEHHQPPTWSTGAELWLHQDGVTSDLFVAFVLPRTLVDNSYGPNNTVDWPRTHKFEELIGSDDAQFQFHGEDNQGNRCTFLDITMDYLHGFGAKKEDPPFRSGGVIDGEGKVTVGSASNIPEAESAMGFNWDTFGEDYPGLFGKDKDSPAADSEYNVGDPLLSGWVFDVTYEFRIGGSAFVGIEFDPTEPGSVTVPLVHASPNKIGKHKVWPQEKGEPIPEPASFVLLGTGIAALLGYARRRSARSRVAAERFRATGLSADAQ